MAKAISRNIWRQLPWKKFQRHIFKLQKGIFKAIREGNKALAIKLQQVLLASASAKWLAIRRVTQLNQGKKTAGIDGKVALSFSERHELFAQLQGYRTWKHKKLREIPIPKKDGTLRILKIPTIADRAWQALLLLAMEPAHEATFHARSYGFRPGRSAHDCQKYIFVNLCSRANGKSKRILELDIKKCFDRIDHHCMMNKVIAPQPIINGLWRCLQAGINPEFPEQGTPQGGIISPLLANIALNGIEDIHPSVRYADDMVVFLKPGDDAQAVLNKITEFLALRKLEIKPEKTHITASTDGFNFLGWHFKVVSNGKFRCVPSEDNYQAFRKKVKTIVNNSNYGAEVKAKKLAPIVRGWRCYHRYCKLNGSRFSLWSLSHRAWQVFNKEKKLNRHQVDKLIKKALPTVPYSENRHVMVKGNSSPYNGDLVYWSQRNSKLYDGATAKTLRQQNHTCECCGLKLTGNEPVELHHVDGNHNNWKPGNLIAIHRSCHQYIHMSNHSQSGSRMR